MSWADGWLAAVDLETTGVDPWTDRPVTCAVVIVPGKGETPDWGPELNDEGRRNALTLLSIIDPGVEVPDEAAAIHGWTTERVRESGEAPELVWPVVREQLLSLMESGTPIVAFNARFDLTMLDAEFGRVGLDPLPWRRIVDPFIIDKAVDTYRKGKRQLLPLCEHYKVDLSGPHDAGFDAIAAARLAWRMADSIPEIGNWDLDELHEAQIDWAYQQAASFKTYLAASFGVTDRRVPAGWPVEDGPDDDMDLQTARRERHPPRDYGGWNSPYG